MSESPIKLPNITQNVHTNEYGVSGLPQTSTWHSFTPNRTRHIFLFWLLESSSSRYIWGWNLPCWPLLEQTRVGCHEL